MILRRRRTSICARRVRRGEANLGEVFAFCSGLYFRGKLAYARRFAKAEADVLVITPSRGLVPASVLVTREDLREFGTVTSIWSNLFTDHCAARSRRWHKLQQVKGPARQHRHGMVRGSAVAALLGERLCFLEEFVGRGDMSRGGLHAPAPRSPEKNCATFLFPRHAAWKKGHADRRYAPCGALGGELALGVFLKLAVSSARISAGESPSSPAIALPVSGGRVELK